jgi:hypothetical protein
MGRVDDKDDRILVENIQSMQFIHSDGGWLRSKDTEITITFLDGRSANFSSSLKLFLLTGEEPEQATIDSLTSIARCGPVPAATGQSVSEDSGSVIVNTVVASKAGLPSTVRIYMNNGDILDGIFITDEVVWRTEYALFSVARQQIKSMSRVEGSEETWTILFKIGSRVTGTWVDDSIQVDLAFGDTIAIDSALIKQIDFSDPE